MEGMHLFVKPIQKFVFFCLKSVNFLLIFHIYYLVHWRFYQLGVDLATAVPSSGVRLVIFRV